MEGIHPNNGFNQDPDYLVPLNSNKNQQCIREENARSTANKISTILENEFSKEIEAKKKEVFEIYKTLQKACNTFHYLRFAIVTDFYNQENALIDDFPPSKQARLHPTVNAPKKKINLIVDCENDCFKEINEPINTKRKIESELDNPNKSDEPKQKISKMDLETTYLRKVKKRIVVGNYSKWIPPDARSNDATHKWTVYVIDSQKTDLGNFVSKVIFFLHPSYQPNDVIELSSSPFHLSKLGWGEFPIRVQLHFKNSFNKPVNIIHNLTLDRTYTGLLTIGSETVADIWINTKDRSLQGIEDDNNKDEFLLKVKSSDTNVSVQVKKEKIEDISSDVQEEKHTDQIFEGNTHNTTSNITAIPILSDHDYIKTNFAPVKSESDMDISEYHLNNFGKKQSRSLLKSNRVDTNCTAIINKEKIFSSNQCHNFEKLPLNSNSKIQFENSKKNFSTEKYNNPKRYTLDKDYSRKLLNLIERAGPTNLFMILKLVMSRIPLITQKSKDSYYKTMFPYTCESYDVFKNLTSGKQHALERCRALHAFDIIKDIQYFESSCSVEDIIMWARRYGYTPLLNLRTLNKLSTVIDTINAEETSLVTKPTDYRNWLQKRQRIKPKMNQVISDSEEEIDVVHIQQSVRNSLPDNTLSKSKKDTVIFLEYPQEYNTLNEFVYNTAQKEGVYLTNEEIVPGVSHSSANLVMSKALECLVNDLTRLALASSIDRFNANKTINFEVNADDVRMALMKREGLNMFTNLNLGSEE